MVSIQSNVCAYVFMYVSYAQFKVVHSVITNQSGPHIALGSLGWCYVCVLFRGRVAVHTATAFGARVLFGFAVVYVCPYVCMCESRRYSHSQRRSYEVQIKYVSQSFGSELGSALSARCGSAP